MTKKITNKKTFKIGTILVGALLGEIAAVIRRASGLKSRIWADSPS